MRDYDAGQRCGTRISGIGSVRRAPEYGRGLRCKSSVDEQTFPCPHRSCSEQPRCMSARPRTPRGTACVAAGGHERVAVSRNGCKGPRAVGTPDGPDRICGSLFAQRIPTPDCVTMVASRSEMVGELLHRRDARLRGGSPSSLARKGASSRSQCAKDTCSPKVCLPVIELCWMGMCWGNRPRPLAKWMIRRAGFPRIYSSLLITPARDVVSRRECFASLVLAVKNRSR